MKKIIYILILFSNIVTAQITCLVNPYIESSATHNTLNDSLFGAYDADYTTTDTVGANNGTSSVLSYTAGIVNQAFVITGASSGVSLPNNSWNFSGSFSISLWVNFTSTGTQSIISNDNGTIGWLIGLYQSKIYFEAEIIPSYPTATMGSTVSTGVWYHVVAVFNYGTNQKLYINGTLQATTSNTSPIVYGTCLSGIGLYSPNTIYTAHAYIDMPTLWKKSLTPTEITSLYNAGAGLQAPYH